MLVEKGAKASIFIMNRGGEEGERALKHISQRVTPPLLISYFLGHLWTKSCFCARVATSTHCEIVSRLMFPQGGAVLLP